MSTKSIEITCEHCRDKFPSPIMLADGDTFDAGSLIGNRMQCPSCGQITGVNKENMRVLFDDGGFTGNAS